MKKKSYCLLLLFLFYSCHQHRQLRNYTSTIFYSDIALVKGKGRQVVTKIDTEKIKASNDTKAYKKALTSYYLRFTTDSIMHMHTYYFVVRDETGVNLKNKLLKKTTDSLDLLVRVEIEETTEAGNFPQLPDSLKPKSMPDDTNSLLRKIRSVDSANNVVKKKKTQ